MIKILKKMIGMLNFLYNKVLFRHFSVIAGKNISINGRVLIKGNKKSIEIGDNCILNSDRSSVPLGYQDRINFWCFQNGRILIGDGCGLSNVTLCSAEKISIGKNVLLGGGVKIFDTDFHSLDYSKRIDIENDEDRRTAPVFIEDGAFIGAGTVILKGVTIGQKSIVGAEAVVTCSIPPNQIWGGESCKIY